jgi:hypothetical protein
VNFSLVSRPSGAGNHARRAVESRHSTDDGLVVAVTAIAVQLVEIGEHAGDIVGV